MSKLLMNGCSYGYCYSHVTDLSAKLGFTETVNLSRGGNSNDKLFRTTVNYVLENSVDFVLLSLTGWDRAEAPWGKTNDPTRCWVDYGPYGILNHNSETQYPHEFYDQYIQDRYRYDLDIRYVEKLLANIIMFAGWLDSIKMPYLIYSSCGGLFTEQEGPNTYGEKFAVISQNPRIVDLENWCSNNFLHASDARCYEYDADRDPSSRHYLPKEHAPLTDFLYNYISTRNLA